MLKIVPVFQRMFEEFGLKLPALTRLVIEVSNWYVQRGWYLTAPLTLLAPWMFLIGFLYYVGWMPRDVPFVWRFFRRYDSALMLRGLALAVRRGKPLPEAMRIIGEVYPIRNIGMRLQLAASQVAAGVDWLASLERVNLISRTDAALLAAAVWEQDRPQDATALLANRLDVLERTGLPDAVYLGYRTAARIAAAEGAEHRALELLEGLRAAGEARNLPRLVITSLAEQARLHAQRFRAESCRTLCERIDAILARDDVPQGRLWRRNAELVRQLAAVSAAIAAQDWSGALKPLARANELAEAIGLGRVRIEIMGLRAFALDRDGSQAEPLLREAMDLASALGIVRPFSDAHPALGEWAARVSAARDTHSADPRPQPARAPAPRDASPPRMNPSMALTPKERRVLELLARNLSNKEIAMAMQIGEETIKWHLKNVFGKLAAGSRKQVVRRAHLLGLLESGA